MLIFSSHIFWVDKPFDLFVVGLIKFLHSATKPPVASASIGAAVAAATDFSAIASDCATTAASSVANFAPGSAASIVDA